jgi:hypothetical protein
VSAVVPKKAQNSSLTQQPFIAWHVVLSGGNGLRVVRHVVFVELFGCGLRSFRQACMRADQRIGGHDEPAPCTPTAQVECRCLQRCLPCVMFQRHDTLTALHVWEAELSASTQTHSVYYSPYKI